MSISSNRSRWHVTGRVLAAVLLGYILANTLGSLLIFVLPVDRISGIIIGTLSTFLFWGAAVMWTFTVDSMRHVMLGLLSAIVLTSAATWAMYSLESTV